MLAVVSIVSVAPSPILMFKTSCGTFSKDAYNDMIPVFGIQGLVKDFLLRDNSTVPMLRHQFHGNKAGRLVRTGLGGGAQGQEA